MVPFKAEIFDKITKALMRMESPGDIPRAHEALRDIFESCELKNEFLKVLQHRIWIATWGSMKIEEIPVREIPEDAKKSCFLLKLTNVNDGRYIDFILEPDDTPIHILKKS